MTWGGHCVLAVVPARGGSKSIERKNLRRVAGRSLIGHVGQVCAALPWLDQALISTDDEEMAAEARISGLDAFFLRPAELSHDSATSIEAWRHAWRAAEEHYETEFDCSVLLEPTSPLRRPDDVTATLGKIIDDGFAAAATVSPTPGPFTPQKTLTRDSGGRLDYYHEDGARYSIRQKIPDYFHRNGVCYAAARAALLDQHHLNLLQELCFGVVIERPLVNIDDPFDLELAEWLMARQADA
jgi:CMP-N-acetylneuraminic acid synthetase